MEGRDLASGQTVSSKDVLSGSLTFSEIVLLAQAGTGLERQTAKHLLHTRCLQMPQSKAKPHADNFEHS